MATNSKVFVSPGVYTSEVDLSFVAQSVGVTTLGIVGETLKGPAFEPIFIRNFDEFTNFFGGTSPEKFINTQIPKYEASYIAKAYLQQSNQLFVTRILGLSGYDAGPSWSLTTKANVDCTTIKFKCLSSTTVNCDLDCVLFETIPFSIPFTGCTFSNNGVKTNTVGITNSSLIPSQISGKINSQFEMFDGSTSTINLFLNNQMSDVVGNTITSGSSIYYYGTIPTEDYNVLVNDGYSAFTNVYEVDNVCSDLANYCTPQNDPWYYSLFDNIGGGEYSGSSFYTTIKDLATIDTLSTCASFYSLSVSSSTVSTTFGNINYNTRTINVVLPSTTPTSGLTSLTVMYSACTTGVTISGVQQQSSGTTQNFSAGTKPYVLIPQMGDSLPWTVNVTIDNPCNPTISGNTGNNNTGGIQVCYSGNLEGVLYVFDGLSYTDFDDLVVATLRSRGIATYGTNSDGPLYQVSGLTDVTLDCTSSTYSNLLKNPYSKFGINVTDYEGNTFSFETSLSESDSKYLSKVFGSSNFGKPRTTVPLFVEEKFQTLLNYGYNKGYIRGLSCDLVALPRAAGENSDPSSLGYYLEKYQTPVSPWIVSELRGNKVFNLFRFITISDGNGANVEVKISIANMTFNNLTFDILVRDFFDTDNNPVVIEKFTNCSMDPNDNSFIAKKIGTSDGEYELNSKYIMVEMNEDAPIDTLPCGFQGFKIRQYGSSKPPFPIYKTKYDFPGEVIFDPPFGLRSGANDSVLSAGDNVRRTYLGISTGNGAGYDVDFFQYKGKQRPLNLCIDSDVSDWAILTKGFHMDEGANNILISNSYTTSGTPSYYVGDATFTSDPTSESSPYYRIYSRKFTLLVQGGFDGWDIYRESRSNTDTFKLGRRGFLNGSCPDSIKYPTATGWGAFKQITVGNNSVDFGNSDYYAYLLGQQTFSNPEAVNINLFVTPGIDYVNNSDLVESAIEMIEFNRADSLYICTTPDSDLFIPSPDPSALIYPQEAVNNLEETGIDSNYTATYYPWVLTRDSVNNTQIYLPPTAEVMRNLALTDNIAFPWFAAAGYTRGIVNAIKARKKLTQEDRDTLYQGRLNPIATFADVGTVIWGNKTLQIAQSALDRINVRRLLLQARKLISAVSVRLLFEQNDQKVRQDFLDAVNPILDAIRRDRGLYDFRVTVSSDAADLDRNQMTGKIYIKPTKSLEFIDITFYITPAGASFENI